MRRPVNTTLALIFLLAACGNPKLEKVEALKKEAISIHDEVMPRMGEIHELELEIKSLKKAMEEDTSDAGQQIVNQLRGHILKLDEADEAMMNWMSDYIVDYEKDHVEDSAIAYYTEQISDIKNVKIVMDQNIDEAKKFIETFQE